MRRGLPFVLFAYAALSAAQWSHAARWLYAPPPGMGCGNVISDPYRWLVKYVTPPAAIASGVLARRCLRARRWSLLGVTGLLAFVATTAALIYEAWWLEHDYGFDGLLDGAWWLPRR